MRVAANGWKEKTSNYEPSEGLLCKIGEETMYNSPVVRSLVLFGLRIPTTMPTCLSRVFTALVIIICSISKGLTPILQVVVVSRSFMSVKTCSMPRIISDNNFSVQLCANK